MEEYIKELKEIEDKFGIEAYNNITNIIWKMQLKINDLVISRNNWKEKYIELEKRVKKEVKK